MRVQGKQRQIKPQPPSMASLPKDRLQVAPAFTKVGVDYFGPKIVSIPASTRNVMGVFLPVLVTRATLRWQGNYRLTYSTHGYLRPSLHLGMTESHTNLEEKFIFQIGFQNPCTVVKRPSFTYF